MSGVDSDKPNSRSPSPSEKSNFAAKQTDSPLRSETRESHQPGVGEDEYGSAKADRTSKSNHDGLCASFDDLKLREALLRGIYAYGFEKPSPFQQRAINPCLSGRDVIAESQAGTGKTAAYMISILEKVDLSLTKCQALVLVPTRELALAIQSVLLNLGHFLDVQCHACVGGTSVRADMQRLKEGVPIVVGTPGRVSDMIQRRALDPSHIKMFVLDEADEVLCRGFKDQICDVFRSMETETQVILLLSTLPPDVLELTQTLMRDPVHIRRQTMESK